MSFKSLALVHLIEDSDMPGACEDYAIQLVEKSGGHLTAHFAIPVPTLPSARVAPLLADIVARAVADRRQNASKSLARMENAARIAGISLEPHFVESDFLDMTEQVVSAARLSEVVVAPRPSVGSEREIAEALLFGAGRPVLLVPPAYAPRPDFSRIVVAWDGSARAARAVGDALSVLSKATEVDIVCVSREAERGVAGAELATFLARYCRRVSVTELPPVDGHAAKPILDHATMTRAGLIVMGAYAHSRLWQRVLGGVTREVLVNAALPVFMSY